MFKCAPGHLHRGMTGRAETTLRVVQGGALCEAVAGRPGQGVEAKGQSGPWRDKMLAVFEPRPRTGQISQMLCSQRRERKRMGDSCSSLWDFSPPLLTKKKLIVV